MSTLISSYSQLPDVFRQLTFKICSRLYTSAYFFTSRFFRGIPHSAEFAGTTNVCVRPSRQGREGQTGYALSAGRVFPPLDCETGGVGRGLTCLLICLNSNTTVYLVSSYLQARSLPAPCPSVAHRARVHDHISHLCSCSFHLVIEVMTVCQQSNAAVLHDQIYF